MMEDPLDKAAVFSTWAPEESAWAIWAKGTVFAAMSFPPPVPDDLPAPDTSWAPAISGRAAIVLDLPEEGVEIALALAQGGHRPVPLYNAIPGFAGGRAVMVDMSIISARLWHGSPRLAQANIAADAPPIFMLLAHRRGDRAPGVGDFDNRSISFPTDFPSGKFLSSAGIKHAIIVQRGTHAVQHDLANTLRGWQAADITLASLDLNDISAGERALVIKPISRLRLFWERLIAQLSFRRSSMGGYGATIPIPSAG